MVGFGFMDNTVMIHAGNAIDLTMGVTFGLSTLSAAACGQICSDMAGVTFGGLIENVSGKLGLRDPEFTEDQRRHPAVKRNGFLGSLFGVFCGCSLGLVNLFFIDTHQARELKLAAASSEAGFSVSISNAERDGVTQVKILGPGTAQGVIAAVTTVMASAGLTIVDMSGSRDMGGSEESSGEKGCLNFQFYLMKGGEQIDDEELHSLARSVMAACNHPERVAKLAKENETLKKENKELRATTELLESRLEEFTITINPGGRRGVASADAEGFPPTTLP